MQVGCHLDGIHEAGMVEVYELIGYDMGEKREHASERTSQARSPFQGRRKPGTRKGPGRPHGARPHGDRGQGDCMGPDRPPPGRPQGSPLPYTKEPGKPFRVW